LSAATEGGGLFTLGLYLEELARKKERQARRARKKERKKAIMTHKEGKKRERATLWEETLHFICL